MPLTSPARCLTVPFERRVRGSPLDLEAVLKAEVARESARLLTRGRTQQRATPGVFVPPSADEMDDETLAVVGVSCELQMGTELLRACDEGDQVTRMRALIMGARNACGHYCATWLATRDTSPACRTPHVSPLPLSAAS